LAKGDLPACSARKKAQREGKGTCGKQEKREGELQDFPRGRIFLGGGFLGKGGNHKNWNPKDNNEKS